MALISSFIGSSTVLNKIRLAEWIASVNAFKKVELDVKIGYFYKKNVAVSQKGYKIRYVPVDLNRTTALASESPLIVSFCK